MIKGTTIALSAVLIGVGATGASQADAAKMKNKNPEVTLLRLGDEGTTAAKLDGKKVWNVRKGYNRVKVEMTSSVTGKVGYGPPGWPYVGDYIWQPPAEYKLRTSGDLKIECLRKRGDAWYESEDRNRTVISGRTRKVALPVKNPYRCRVSLDASLYPHDTLLPAGTFPPGAELTQIDPTYTLLKATVTSVKK
ncbi:MAG: hypothetical protein ISP32_08000 [Thermoleophilia bacterium]|nr:hypothetical protein [Thermoleophilia bacterium]